MKQNGENLKQFYQTKEAMTPSRLYFEKKYIQQLRYNTTPS